MKAQSRADTTLRPLSVKIFGLADVVQLAEAPETSTDRTLPTLLASYAPAAAEGTAVGACLPGGETYRKGDLAEAQSDIRVLWDGAVSYSDVPPACVRRKPLPLATTAASDARQGPEDVNRQGTHPAANRVTAATSGVARAAATAFLEA